MDRVRPVADGDVREQRVQLHVGTDGAIGYIRGYHVADAEAECEATPDEGDAHKLSQPQPPAPVAGHLEPILLAA